jgi:hypothetical protein
MRDDIGDLGTKAFPPATRSLRSSENHLALPLRVIADSPGRPMDRARRDESES